MMSCIWVHVEAFEDEVCMCTLRHLVGTVCVLVCVNSAWGVLHAHTCQG